MDPVSRSETAGASPFGDGLTPARFAALLLLATAAAFPEVVSGAATFVHRDYMHQTFPVAEYWRASFWRGEIPLWNPYNNSGIPFLAQWSTGVLYPPSLLYLLLPSPSGFAWFCLAHLPVAGLSMYVLALHHSGSRLAASVAGAAYAFTGVMLATLHLPASLGSMAWAPLVLLLAERAWREGGALVAGAAAVGALQMLAGYPEFILVTWLVAAVQLLGGLVFDRLPPARTLLRFAALVALVAGLCAAQLGPFLELFAASQRDPGFGAASAQWGLPAWGVANWVVPLFRVQHSLHGVPFQVEQEFFSSTYPGIVALAAALVATLRVRGWRVASLAGIAVVGVLLAMGPNGPLYDALAAVVPAIGVARFPVKLVFAAALVLPWLAALGVAACEHRVASGGPLRFELGVGAALCVAAVGLVAWSRAFPTYPEPWTTALASGALRIGILGAAGGLLLFGPRLPHPAARRVAPVAAVALVALDGLSHAPGLNPTVPARAWAPVERGMDPLPALGAGRAMMSPRAYAFFQTSATKDLPTYLRGQRIGLTGNLNLLDRIPVVGGHFWVEPAGAWRVREMLYRRVEGRHPRVEDFLAVTWTSSERRRFGWQPRDSARPLVTGGQAPVFVSAREALAALAKPDFDPTAVVYLPAEARGASSIAGPAAVRVTPGAFEPHRVAFDVDADAPAWVVVAQTHHAPWRARVDGRATPVWRANVAFQALEVPAGRHTVELAYEDRAFRRGVAISALTAAFCALQALRHLRLRARRLR